MDRDYFKKLKARSAESRVYRKFQLQGLELADILKDRRHKALYIKLAKEGDPERLRILARGIAENPGIRNKGAYFMSCLREAEASSGEAKARLRESAKPKRK